MLQDIEAKVAERTERLENIIKSRASTEKWVTGMLTIISLVCISSLYMKITRKSGNKRIGGSFGGPASNAYQQNDFVI